jgi:hypothetical protein
MMKRIILNLIIILAMTATIDSIQGQTPRFKIPDNVKTSFEWLLRTEASNGVFRIEKKASYFYVLKDAVYVNVLFTALLKEDQQEINQKLKAIHQRKLEQYNQFVSKFFKKLDDTAKDEKDKWKRPPRPKLVRPAIFHDLYVQVIKDKKVWQNFKAPVPVNQEEEKYYSFALILRPGEYIVLVNINRLDNSKDGTMIIRLNVPRITIRDITEPVNKLEYTAPVFYRKVVKAENMGNRFTVFKNKFAIAPTQLFHYPYFKNEFTREQKPVLAFFLKGFLKKDLNPAWNIKADLGIYKEKKRIIRYETIKLNNPYFYQILDFGNIRNGGDYELGIRFVDLYRPGFKGTVVVPFKISNPPVEQTDEEEDLEK